MQAVVGDMELVEAEKLVAEHSYFDYLKGRVMKISIKERPLDFFLYDRDNGEGAGVRVIEGYKVEGEISA